MQVGQNLWNASGRRILVASLLQRLLAEEPWAAQLGVPGLEACVDHWLLRKDEDWAQLMGALAEVTSEYQKSRVGPACISSVHFQGTQRPCLASLDRS